MRPPLALIAASLTTLAVVSTGICVGGLYQGGWLPLTFPDRAALPYRGIDVSHHQGAVDWEAVAGDDVQFVYLKATEGGDWTDPRFGESWAATRAAGLRRGAYHYFTLCRPAEDQARNVIATVPNDPDALPIAIDLEFVGNCAARPPIAELRASVDHLRSRLREHYGVEPILYVTDDFYRAYLDGHAPEARWWRRAIVGAPSGPYLIWQHRDHARVAGISGPVDVNVAAPGLIDAS